MNRKLMVKVLLRLAVIILVFLLLYVVWENHKEAKLEKIKAEGYAEMERVMPCEED